MVLIVAREDAEAVRAVIEAEGEKVYELGGVVGCDGDEFVEISGADVAWV
jgi:phosphoribosylaminoimidazole (AIR) synthetase